MLKKNLVQHGMSMQKRLQLLSLKFILQINMNNKITKPMLYGILASSILLGVYFTILTLVSGWSFAQEQFASYWYFVVSLAIGFGIQIGLYQYIKGLVHSGQGMGKVVG